MGEIVLNKSVEISEHLEMIAKEENVRLLFAVESGSRAWGHPSPDSDYDVRFVYVRPLEWYLSLAPGRDVIERPVEADIDLSAWDLKKALSLLLKPSPVRLEWLSSPTRYVWSEGVCSRLTAFAARTAHSQACWHHYHNLAKRQRKQHIENRDIVNLKKYFYVLRPALALRWMRLNPSKIPPMDMIELIRGSSLDKKTIDEIDNLLALKAHARESGEGLRCASLDALTDGEIAASQELPERSAVLCRSSSPPFVFCAACAPVAKISVSCASRSILTTIFEGGVAHDRDLGVRRHDFHHCCFAGRTRSKWRPTVVSPTELAKPSKIHCAKSSCR